MIFTCDNIDAAEAYRIGLVNKVVAKEELMETAKAMAAKIISKGSYAVSVAKAACFYPERTRTCYISR